MFDSLKRVFDRVVQQSHPQKDVLRTAAAILLLEVATADFELTASERILLKKRLQEASGLMAAELDQLVDDAMQQHDLAVSLHEQVDVLNAHCDAAQKRQLLHDLWTMAYADGELHHYEEAVIRRIADLLYVPHRVFLQTKHEVSGQP